MTQCFVCCNCQNIILIQSSEGKETFLYLHMLRIHTSLRKLSKTNVYDLHLKKMNPFNISKPCIKIEKIEMLFEKYRMAINQNKYNIEVLDDDAIKRNRIFIDFTLIP